MTYRPILFSAPMVRALLDGSKTQTRRVAKVEITMGHDSISGPRHGKYARVYLLDKEHDLRDIENACPYGQPGDRLWVREAWRTLDVHDHIPPREMDASYRLWFEADTPHQPGFGKYRPGMFMPRWASRITLEIVSARVELLQYISETDAISEGIPRSDHGTGSLAKRAYQALWESINGPGSWAANPWVWVVEFKSVTS